MNILKSSAGLLWFVSSVYGNIYPVIEHALCPLKRETPRLNPQHYSVKSALSWKTSRECQQRVKTFTHAFSGKRDLVFIDARDEHQCAWAVQHKASIIVLVYGKPVHFLQKYKRRVWVDYADKLSQFFHLHTLPARVMLGGHRARICEGLC